MTKYGGKKGLVVKEMGLAEADGGMVWVGQEMREEGKWALTMMMPNWGSSSGRKLLATFRSKDTKWWEQDFRKTFLQVNV